MRRILPSIGVAAGIAAGLISGSAMVGQVATLAGVLTVFFSGFAGGASLAAGRRRKAISKDPTAASG